MKWAFAILNLYELCDKILFKKLHDPIMLFRNWLGLFRAGCF